MLSANFKPKRTAATSCVSLRQHSFLLITVKLPLLIISYFILSKINKIVYKYVCCSIGDNYDNNRSNDYEPFAFVNIAIAGQMLA